MKRAIRLASALVLAFAACTQGWAATLPSYPDCGFEVHVYPGGETYLVNPTASAIAFASYDITDYGAIQDNLTSCIDPDNWISFESWVDGGQSQDIIDLMGNDAVGFEAWSFDDSYVAEALMIGTAYFAADSSFYLGDIFSGWPSTARVAANFAVYVDGDWEAGSGSIQCKPYPIPEPASMTLLALGAAAMLRRRRA